MKPLFTTEFFDHLTRQVLKVTGSGTTTLAGDGTIIEAMSSRFQLMWEEALAQALAEAKDKVQTHPSDTAAVQRGIELLCPEGQSLGDDCNKQSTNTSPKAASSIKPTTTVTAAPTSKP